MDVSLLQKRDLPFLRRGIGIVFQDFKLLNQKTVFENVAFAMEITGASGREIRRQVPLVLDLMGLGRKDKSFPHQLSGGEQQRVALARAIVNAPSIIIADEPTGNLDPKNSSEIMNLLNEINKKGTTVIVTTHEKHFVDTMGKRVISIRQGCLVRDDRDGGYYEDDDEEI
jgi:cell division transport system ATP-binding protein